MSSKPPVYSTIEAYRKKRQKLNPLVLYLGAAVLIIVGIVIIILSLSGGGTFTLFPPRAPLSTSTPALSDTPVSLYTPTITSTPTASATATPGSPFVYIVQEGDYLSKICEDKQLGENCLLLILLLNPSIDPISPNIYTGSEIILPNPGMPLPSPTPIPDDAITIKYFVLPGDYLGLIAVNFNTTVDLIVKANPDILEDETSPLYPGQYLQIPINRVTPVPTSTVTRTPMATASATSTTSSLPTATPSSTASVTPTH